MLHPGDEPAPQAAGKKTYYYNMREQQALGTGQRVFSYYPREGGTISLDLLPRVVVHRIEKSVGHPSHFA